MTTEAHATAVDTLSAEGSLPPYDALLLMSYGGPDRAEDVIPFLKNVTSGRAIPEERLAEVGEHYYGFGGKSPINEQNLALRAALEGELVRRGLDLPVLWGNRNWKPFLTDVLREAAQRGQSRFLAVITSAYESYSSSDQYLEDFAAAEEALRAEGLDITVDKVRQYHAHEGFVEPQKRIVLRAVEELAQKLGHRDAAGLEESQAADLRILYVTHSIPTPMQELSERGGQGYRQQHEAVIAASTEALAARGVEWGHELVFCSRSGAPGSPWLEPDINDRLEELAAQGVRGVVVVPIGFISDHMEVKFDLDTEARETARSLGIAFVRAATVGTDGDFVKGLIDLAVERSAAEVRGEVRPG